MSYTPTADTCAYQDVINMQAEYAAIDKTGFTKRQLIELVVPFRDKYGLSDMMALTIVRGQVAAEPLRDWCVLNDKFHTRHTKCEDGSDKLYYHEHMVEGMNIGPYPIEWWEQFYHDHVNTEEHPTFKHWWAEATRSGWLKVLRY